MQSRVLRRLARTMADSEWSWRYISNLAPTLSYKFNRLPFSVEGARVLDELNRNGVAITSVERLLGKNSCYQELARSVEGLESDLCEEINNRRADAEGGSIGRKSYVFELLGANPAPDAKNIYTRFAAHEAVRQIADAYFEMRTRLHYYNVWHTFVTRSKAREAQLWHRDFEDRYICKVFVYLTDVDKSSGPFTYAAGSHPRGNLKRAPEFYRERFDGNSTRRSDDAQMAAAVPRDRWVECVGPKGTMVFADTRGYHRGGKARGLDRVLYTCMFTSQAAKSLVSLTLASNSPGVSPAGQS